MTNELSIEPTYHPHLSVADAVDQVAGDDLIPLAQAAIRREAALLRIPMESDPPGHRAEMEKRANALDSLAVMLGYLDHVI